MFGRERETDKRGIKGGACFACDMIDMFDVRKRKGKEGLFFGWSEQLNKSTSNQALYFIIIAACFHCFLNNCTCLFWV